MRRVTTAALAAVLISGSYAGCSSQEPSDAEAGVALPSSDALRYPGAYIARVVATPVGDDLQEGGGEFVVISNNAGIRTDMGGWWVEDADGNRLALGVGRQVEAGESLRLYSSCGKATEHTLFACVGQEVLDDAGDVLTLRDSAGTEVARFAYGDQAA